MPTLIDIQATPPQPLGNAEIDFEYKTATFTIRLKTITDGNAVFPGPKREDVVAKSRRSLDRSCLSRPPEIIWSQLGTARDHLEAAGDHLGAAGGSWSPDGSRWRPSGSQSGRLFIIYYKSSHRPSNGPIFTCFRALGTPKSHVYPIIYISKSTF